MAADLHIHVAHGDEIKHVTEYLKEEFSCHGPDGSYKGYRLFKLKGSDEWVRFWQIPEDQIDLIEDQKEMRVEYDEDIVFNTPSVWVGEVSWLKAALFEDPESFIPDLVGAVQDVIHDLVLIDDKLIESIKAALNHGNKTGYSVTEADTVLEFLEGHKGKSAFTISW